jgi:uncharacterized protein (DUF1697 family)
MPRYVALFRGINVGKAKRIAMADLRALLATLGYTDVATLLNSGNALFTARSAPNDRHARRIRDAVAKNLGVDAHVVVKSDKEIAAIVAENALAKIAGDPSRLLVAIVQDGKALAAVRTLVSENWGREKLHVVDGAAYVWCAEGILESRLLGALLTGLKNPGTTRNWATLLRIHSSMEKS